MNIDLTTILAGIIDVQGGEVRLPFQTFVEQTGEKAITLDFEDDGQMIVLRLIDAAEVPEDATD